MPRPPRKDITKSSAALRFQKLDKAGFTPLYVQMQEQLVEKIRSGALKPGSALPGEDVLARIFEVSRMTGRQALQLLKSEGFAVRERGRGTFVSEAKVEKDITHLLGFTAEMKALGLKPSTSVLHKRLEEASPQIASNLRIASGDPVLSLHRRRCAQGKPVAIERVWLPAARFPGIERTNLERSLYTILRERYDVRVDSADEVIEARPATKDEAALLEIPVRSSLLVITRTLLDARGVPIETGYSLFRGDRYRAVFHLPAKARFKEQHS